MERIGKYFQFGYPHFDRGIEYNWPNEEINFEKLIAEKQDDLGEFLLDKTRNYLSHFSGKNQRTYPYLQKGMKGLALHIGDGGRWIEIWKMIGASFLGVHNLYSYIERMIAFNIGSDTLEFFDTRILTPRVFKEKDDCRVNYFLPQGLNIIPTSSKYSQDNVKRLFNLMGLDSNLTLTFNPHKQEILSSQGLITTEKGVCEVRGFKGFNIAKASRVASTLMSFCE